MIASDGYWLPHTSSIDFCETNYAHLNSIVELHNTWSSLAGISFFGLIGFWKGNPTREIRYSLAYVILFLIGVGSAGLHGTLHWIFQSSDELPMIYLVTVMNFMAVEFDSPQGKPKYPKLPSILFILLLINTLIYYTFQHLYLVFVTTYTAITFYHFYLIYNLIHKAKGGGPLSQKLSRWSLISYIGSFLLWLVDMFHCELSSRLFGTAGMTFHVVWHFGAGLGAYLGMVALENCRCVALGIPCRLNYVYCLIPVLELVHDEPSSKDD
eukprot:CAMPEP_0176502522 /NCGR_PEP_ID=MMETSP0200_2-20121128/14800_1 /TAXON_ID=947934 /ORGANISM="Chaetoceros sp., Strain GSL56" /LENGTH=267 /DNA_ID=CAMNT_0017901603 /DNA_START=133 /DNA_END=936 /DNA_ORIENTATION=+